MHLLGPLLLALAGAAAAQDRVEPPPRALLLTDPDGESVPDADVWIVDAPPWEKAHGFDEDAVIPWIRRVGRRAHSDAGGRVELFPGELPLLALAETRTLVSRLPTRSSWVGEGPWQGLARSARGDVWLRMVPKGPVEVLVLDAEGRPVAEQEVHLPFESSHPPHYDDALTSARTDDAGIARLPWAGAVSGGYALGNELREGAGVCVSLPLETSVRAWVTSGERGVLQLPPTVDLVVRCPVGGGSLVLERARRPDEPTPGLPRRAGAPRPIVQRVGSFEDGMLVRRVPFTAPFTVRVTAGRDRWSVERTIDPAEHAGLRELHVALAAPAGAPPPTTQASVVVSGQLVDSEGRPLGGGRFQGRYTWATLDERGRFRELPVPAGFELKLSARARDGGPWYGYASNVPRLANGSEVDLGVLHPRPERPLVAGVVVDEGGDPVAGAQVRILDPASKRGTSASRYASTDARGRFLWRWREGTTAPRTLRLTAAEGSRRARWSEVTVGDAEARIELLAGGVLRARLALEEGVPTTNLVAELVGPRGDRETLNARRRVPFADGGFEFSALPEGTYDLGLLALGTERSADEAVGLQVVPGEVCERELLAPLDEAWRLGVADVLVVDEAGAPVAGVLAWLGPSDYEFDRFAPVAGDVDGRILLALHPGVQLGTEAARATFTAPGRRTRGVALVPGPQQVVLAPASPLTLHLGEAFAREHAAATIELYRWSESRGPIRLLSRSGSPKSGVVTFAVDATGPWDLRWVEGGRSWSLEHPALPGSDGLRDLDDPPDGLEVPAEGLELRLDD